MKPASEQTSEPAAEPASEPASERLASASPHIVTAIPGPQSQAWAARLHQAECPEVTWLAPDFPVFWERAAGVMVEDVDGNRFLDLTAAFAVASIGHAHPRVVETLQAQAPRLIHGMGDVHPSRLKVELAEKLSRLTDGALGLPIFGCSGAEAMEAARKTALVASGRTHLIAFTGAYHGLTLGALELTARAEFRAPFQSQLSGTVTRLPYPSCYRCPYGKTYGSCQLECLQHLERTLDDAGSGVGDVGGIVLEPIQGRGGTVVPPPEYLPGLRKLCDERQILLVLDEIYTGFGRTGRLFAHEHWNIRPDIMAVGKALGGGMPISACIGKPEVMRRWPPSQGEAIHTGTFLGHPLSCAAALTALEVLEQEKLVERSARLGSQLKEALWKLALKHPEVGDVRGEGLMLGVELVTDRQTKTPATALCIGLMKWALQKGLLLLPEGTHGNILGITPPLVVQEQQLAWAVERIDEGLSALKA